MFQSFTGTSRRPRQVNLSGRNPNPFANQGNNTGLNAALANAQQDRIQRQRERDRLNAAKTLQRTWRGHNSRNNVKGVWRAKWDSHEQIHAGKRTDKSSIPYGSAEENLMQFRLLAHFFNPRDTVDGQRLLHYCSRSQLSNCNVASTSEPWPLVYLRLENLCLQALDFRIGHPSRNDQAPHELDPLLEALETIAELIPQQTAIKSENYYRVLARLTQSVVLETRMTLFLRVLIAPLRKIHSETLSAYSGFASHYLIVSNLHSLLKEQHGMEELADQINIRLLARATVDLLNDQPPMKEAPNASLLSLLNSRERLGLLANFIFFHRKAHHFAHPEAYSSNHDFVMVVSKLLSSLADEIDVEARSFTNVSDIATPHTFDEFVEAQLVSLVNQDSIRGVLQSTHNESKLPHASDQSSNVDGMPSNGARNFAGYILNLLRLFPRRGDEIRMWLYLGSTNTLAGPHESAVAFFWEAARRTGCFQTITRDSKAAFELLKTRGNRNRDRWEPPRRLEEEESRLDDEWRLILAFMELYTFMLKVMDDEEFFSGSNSGTTRHPMGSLKTRQNALPLAAIQELSTFLKNLGFTLYFHGAELSESAEARLESNGISSYFGHSPSNSALAQSLGEESRRTHPAVAGVAGISIDYVKGLTTGLLRMIYERDSRRKFLPQDHWLMTSRFDMDAFIPSVVEEEESRNKIEDDDDDDSKLDDEGEDEYAQPSLIGTSRTQQIRHVEKLRREQRRLSRKRYLQAVAPRLEILQNMPFFIPFATRVQIFREFVHLDQVCFVPMDYLTFLRLTPTAIG